MTPSFMSQTSWVVSRSTLFVHQFFIPMAEVWLYQEAEVWIRIHSPLSLTSSPGIWWWNYWVIKKSFYSRRSMLVILRHPVGFLLQMCVCVCVCVCVCACVSVGAWAHVHEHMLWAGKNRVKGGGGWGTRPWSEVSEDFRLGARWTVFMPRAETREMI